MPNWPSYPSTPTEYIFKRWTQQCLIPCALLQCDPATPQQEVEFSALALESGLVLMMCFTNQMCCKWQDILGLSRLCHQKHFSFGLDPLKYSLWEAQAIQISHVWGLQVSATVELPVNNQHQLPALWVRHLEHLAYSTLQISAASARTSSIICRAQCKMKTLSFLFKKY